MNPATAPRMTADERREAVLDAARTIFAEGGYYGASTDAIAEAAGISQPYLFRLFGTKKELFIASIRRCFREALETFQRAAEGLRGEEALRAGGDAYVEMLGDRNRLRLQMQAYAACDDPEICAAVREGYGDLYTWCERVSGVEPAALSNFFAHGMLLNVVAAMNLLDSQEPWAQRLVAGCKEEAGS